MTVVEHEAYIYIYHVHGRSGAESYAVGVLQALRFYSKRKTATKHSKSKAKE